MRLCVSGPTHVTGPGVFVSYALLKNLHMLTVLLSGAGFVLRFAASLSGAGWVRAKPARILPHVVDTLLLATAISLLFVLALNPLTQPWLLAKLCALLLYIGLGMIALNPARRTGQRWWAGSGAVLVFLYIVSVAVLKHPAGVVGRLVNLPI